MRLKKVLSWTLALALSFSLAAPALAADTSFSDVRSGDWYYTSVMQCVEKGLMQGMGNGTFSPNTQMTVGQFITVAINAAYPNQTRALASGEEWWEPYYELALGKHLIRANEYAREKSVMNVPITRKEMARIAYRVTKAKGEKVRTSVSTASIADYASIDAAYRSYIQDCFAKGILVGMDEKGTFTPEGVLTRAEGCTVALRLIDQSVRTPNTGGTNAVISETHEYYEGELRTNFPQVGDVVIKADGTRVTLEIGPGGVFGACQGVDPYSGIIINGIIVEIDTIVSEVGQTPLLKDPITGEVHTGSDWTKINVALSPTGKYVGNYDGEIYDTWFQWDAVFGLWSWIGPRN